MRKVSYIVLFFCLVHSLAAQTECVGTWTTIDDKTGLAKSEVTIYESNGKFYGKVTKLLNRPATSTGMCDKCNGSLKGQAIVGMGILENAYFKDGYWQGASILDPENGKTYSCKFWLKDGNRDQLELRGFLGISALGRTQTWHRVK
jgi:uncharacterized protein (DUF2147 family)